jgi:hydrogenase/urease accessory protein HupE
MGSNPWIRHLTSVSGVAASAGAAAHGYHPPDPSPLWTLLHQVSQPDYLAVIVLVVLLGCISRTRP